MTLMILFLNGLCMGASILMGTQYGAKDYDKLHRQISTNYAVRCYILFYIKCAVYSACHTYIAYFTVDASIMKLTTSYMRIIFIGLVFYISVQLLLKHTKGARRQPDSAVLPYCKFSAQHIW